MGKLFELINRDTKQKNESKRMTVLIRQLLLMFMCLSLFHLFIDFSLLTLRIDTQWRYFYLHDVDKEREIEARNELPYTPASK